jgi:putative transcriptional regulator
MEKGEFDKLFGEFVLHKRESLKWTQNDLAERINSEFQNISRLERGKVSPSLYWLNTLAKGFETTLGELMSEFDLFVKQKLKEPSRQKH